MTCGQCDCFFRLLKRLCGFGLCMPSNKICQHKKRKNFAKTQKRVCEYEQRIFEAAFLTLKLSNFRLKLSVPQPKKNAGFAPLHALDETICNNLITE